MENRYYLGRILSFDANPHSPTLEGFALFSIRDRITEVSRGPDLKDLATKNQVELREAVLCSLPYSFSLPKDNRIYSPIFDEDLDKFRKLVEC